MDIKFHSKNMVENLEEIYRIQKRKEKKKRPAKVVITMPNTTKLFNLVL